MMKYKAFIKKKLSTLKKLYIIYLILFSSFTNSQVVFPDHYVKNDVPFQESEISSQAKIQYILNAGYFTATENKIIYSFKYGIHYYPDKTCNGIYGNGNSNPFFQNNFIKYTDNTETTNSDPNISEETELYSYYMYGNDIICQVKFPSIHNSNYMLYYKIPIIQSATYNENIIINFIIISSTGIERELKICSKQIQTYHIFHIRIRSILLGSPNNIRMYFKCDDQNEVFSEMTEQMKFKINIKRENSNNIFYLSNYVITFLDTSLNPYGTRNGLPQISTNLNDPNIPDCISHYYKSGSNCEKCHYSCFECSSEGTTCDSCNILSDYSNLNNDNGQCKINYINFQNFQDFSFEIGPPETHRLTYGFWVYISNPENISNLNTNVFHIVLNDLIISTISINRDSVDSYCHVFENLNQDLKNTLTFGNYRNKIIDDDYVYNTSPNSEQQKYLDSFSIKGQWFFSSCAMSFDHGSFYVNTVMNNKDNFALKSIKKEKMFVYNNNVYLNDYHFRINFNNNKQMIVQFKNLGKLASPVFIKNFIVFKEYLPYEFHYMYFNFNGIENYEELLYVLPLNELSISGITYSIKGYDAFSKEEKTITLYLENVNFNGYAPLNFKHLVLLPPNQQYKNINNNLNLTDIHNIIVPNNAIYGYYDNKALKCQNSFHMTQSKECQNTCNNYIYYPGINEGNFCDYLCTNSMNCNLDPSSYSNFCKNSENIYELYYKCVDKSKNYYLQFSDFYNSEDIKIDLSSYGLKSYIIEFWYYPDIFLQGTPGAHYAYLTEHYIFYSNSVSVLLYLDSGLFEAGFNGPSSRLAFKHFYKNEWNKFIIYCIKTPGGKYHLSAYMNNFINDPHDFGQTDVNEDLISIVFCNKCTEDLKELNWGTGYYKGLRVWHGDKSSVPLTVFYDSMFTTYNTDSIITYFPLSNYYIINNQIYDIKNNNYIDLLSSSYSNFRFQKINYSSKFDFIATVYPSLGKFLSSFSPGLTPGNCAIGCKRCWEQDLCYECFPGYFLYIQQCRISEHYFFNTHYDGIEENSILDIKIGNDINGITVNFWVKVIDFSNNNGTIVHYSDKTYLYYESDETSSKFGLSLIHKESGQNIISRIKDFREYIGKWVFISVSYHEKKSDTIVYFPTLIKFEMDTFSYKINNYQNLLFDKFQISKNFYGLMYSLKFFSNFLIGAYGFEMNSGNMITPFVRPTQIGRTYFPMGTTQKNCYQTNYFIGSDEPNNNFNCFADYEDKLFSKVSSFDNYFKEGSTNSIICNEKCFNACYEGDEDKCTCLNLNNNSQMIIKNNNDYYCKIFDFINFAKAKPITINKIKTAKFTKRFTLQFWFYPIEYNSESFTSITFIWKGHLKINAALNDNSYYFYCYYYNKDNEEKGELKTTFNINEWNFLSCAYDHIDHFFYLNTYETLIKKNLQNEGVILNRIVLEDDYTTLTISDDSIRPEWGLLFYRQIRLWSDAFFNAEFLSRVKIETPSLFNNLLHCYEPIFPNKKKNEFNTNFIVKDITLTSDDFIVEKEDTYGINYINETKEISLCSENGEFYDKSLKKCVQFTDVSKMEDFYFSNIPPSYSGSYTMAFWIFLEDSSTIPNGIHLKWEKHLQITIVKKEKLVGYCFPQGYYSDDVDNTNIHQKFENSFNKAQVNLLKDDQVESGNWIWTICAVSNYIEEFYINGNRDEVTINKLNREIIFTYGGEQKSQKVLRYFMSDVSNEVSKKTNLYLENITNSRKIYFRSIQLFRDYLPYNMQIKYVDLSKVEVQGDNAFPQLLFVANFEKYNLNNKRLTYTVFTPKTVSESGKRQYPKTDYTVQTKVPSGSTFELSSNFVFLPLCNLKYDYNPITNQCNTIINTCANYLCYDVNNPLTCRNGEFLNIDSNYKVSCLKKCNNNKMRTPGTYEFVPLCNANLPEDHVTLDNFNGKDLSITKFCSQIDFFQIDYLCKAKPKNSALFYSRCYNPPNFTFTINNNLQKSILNGYFLEFWFKLDTVLNTCSRIYSKEYLFYANPHSIYLDTENNNFYYNIIGTINTKILNGISLYEWNKILIKATLGSITGQNVYIYINNSPNPEPEFLNIEESINLQLQSISFCSNGNNGQCSIASMASINWGSAYYRDIKLWEIDSSSFETILIANSEYLKNHLYSMKVYFPLTFETFDKNVILNALGDGNDIKITHIASNNFDTNDNFLFTNFQIDFDWIEIDPNNLNHYISNMENKEIIPLNCHNFCKRCYSALSTYCYQCKEGYVLIGQTCTKITGYFLTSFIDSSIEINVSDIVTPDEPLIEFTISFFMKFIGVIRPNGQVEDKYKIMSFNDDFFLSYKISNNALTMSLIDNVDKYVDYNFNKYLGTWIHISVCNYKSPNHDIFPHMIVLTVNKIDIVPEKDFVMHKDGAQLLYLRIGNQIIAYFSDLKIYNKFHYGIFGHAKSSDIIESENRILAYSLMGDLINNCVSLNDPKEINNSIFSCVPDYNPYKEKECLIPKEQYFDLSLGNDDPCKYCHNICKSECFLSSEEDCQCDLSKGIYWLRKNKSTKRTYCENVPFIDYSLFEPITINVPSSASKESTIEMWVFLYSYNTVNNKFNYVKVEWDFHNKIEIRNIDNILNLFCYSYYLSSDNANTYNEYLSKNINMYKWVHIKCGSDFIYKTFFLDDISNAINFDLPERQMKSTLKITTPLPSIDYGFIFLRNIKLWQQYNFQFIDSKYINLVSHGSYKEADQISNSFYPGLLTYIKGDLSINDYEKTKEGKYTIYNLLGDDETDIKYTIDLIRRDTFKNYNYIDPENINLYSIQNICDEGYIFNEGTGTCISVFSQNCEFVADSKYNCLTCPESNVYLNPDTGECLNKCPVKYFDNFYMNQCRKCHITCYTCIDENQNTCLSCIDPTFLLVNEYGSFCVENCEYYGLTSSKINGNLCVEFEADAVLINVSEDVPINRKEFNYIEVKITSNKDSYGKEWRFNPDKTREVNNDPDMIFPSETPFIDEEDINKEIIKVDKNFFELGKKYVFELDIYRNNEDSIVLITKTFILTINSPPINGELIVFPEIGLFDTTVFVISSIDWIDDTTEDLMYYFYYIEEKTTTIKKLTQSENREKEIMSKFTYIYPEESNYITIYCEVIDNYGESTKVEKKINIVKQIWSGLYTIQNAFDNYFIPSLHTVDDIYRRSEFLKSLGINPNEDKIDYQIKSYFEPSLDKEIIMLYDPECVDDYCNKRGKCEFIDKTIICNCDKGFIGRNCQFEEDYFYDVADKYSELYNILFSNLKETISFTQLKAIHNLFFAASKFFETSTFFIQNVDKFLSLSQNLYIDSIIENTKMYFDLIDFYYTIEVYRMNKLKLKHKLENNGERGEALTESEALTFKDSFEYLSDKVSSFLKFIMKLNKYESFNFDTENFFASSIIVAPSFNENNYFSTRKSKYYSQVLFSRCLNYIENKKLGNSYYQLYLIYVEFYNFPYAFNNSLYINNTSPLIDISFVDIESQKDISLSECYDTEIIKVKLPFTSYKWLNDLNRQISLFDPNNYYNSKSPIFKDPIYVNKSGYILNETSEERIKKYSRLFNFSCTYLKNNDFIESGINYNNLSEYFVEFYTSHLTKFTTFFKENNESFHFSSRFFYLKKPEILKWFPNYKNNSAFFILGGFLLLYIILLIIFYIYDNLIFKKGTLLESLKVAIVKSFIPYEKNKDIEALKLIPYNFDPGINPLPPEERKEKPFKIHSNKVLRDRDINKLDNINESFHQTDESKIYDELKMNDIQIYKNKKKLNGNYIQNNDENGKSKAVQFNIKKQGEDNESDLNSTIIIHKKNLNIELNDKKIRIKNIKEKIMLNNLPENFEDSEEDYKQRLDFFQALEVPILFFIFTNIKERHNLINPFFNTSLFNRRWIKITIFITDIYITSLMISIFLTSYEFILEKQFLYCLIVGICSNIISNIVIYILIFFFQLTYKQRKRLFYVVTKGGEMVVLKEWENIQDNNFCFILIGLTLCIGIWMFSFYTSFCFYAVWTIQNKAYLLCFLLAFIFDFILTEFLIELLIGLFYIFRSSDFMTKCGENLNYLRNYRCLWP